MKQHFFYKTLLLLVSIFIAPLFFFSCLSKPQKTIMPPVSSFNETFITEVKTHREGENVVISLFNPDILNYTSFIQKNPPTLILDIPDIFFNKNITPFEYQEGLVEKVIPAQITSQYPVKARLTILMKENFSYEIVREEGQLKIIILTVQRDYPSPEKEIAFSEEKKLIETIPSKTQAPSQATVEIPKREIVRSVSSLTTRPPSHVQRPEEAISEQEKSEKRATEVKETEAQAPFLLKKEYTGKPISLDFQNADIRSVLRLIADVSGHNLVIDPEVQGKVDINLAKPVPWDQALDVILKTNKLDMKMEGDIIRVGLPSTFSGEKEADAKRIKAEREAKEEMTKARPLKTQIVTINYAKAAVLMEKLTPMLSKGTGLSEPPSMMVDERTNTLIIKDLPEVLDAMSKLIEKLDHQTPQVMIEARIVQTSKNFTKDFGIQWGGNYSKETNYRFPNTINLQGETEAAPFAVNLPGAGFGAIGITLGHVNGTNSLDIKLQAMEESGMGRILSNPRILTLNNEAASIFSGTDIPYQTVTKEGNLDTDFVTAAVGLEVTPQITPDNNIILQLTANKSEPDWGNQVNGVPSIATRIAKSKLIIKNGDTAVIGGLNTQVEGKGEKKVPFFADIPILGHLFRKENTTNNLNEILIFITPRVIVNVEAKHTP